MPKKISVFPAAKKAHRSQHVKAKRDLADHVDLTSHFTNVVNENQTGIVTYLKTHD